MIYQVSADDLASFARVPRRAARRYLAPRFQSAGKDARGADTWALTQSEFLRAKESLRGQSQVACIGTSGPKSNK